MSYIEHTLSRIFYIVANIGRRVWPRTNGCSPSSRKFQRGHVWRVLLITLLGITGLVWWQPRFAIRWIAKLAPDVLFFVDTEQPVVALSLDDGPHATTTPQLLDVLAEHRAHATFFLLGERIRGNEEIVRRLVKEGHELGNHQMTEQRSFLLSPPEFESQLLQSHELLSPFGATRWFRPGSGWFNQRMLDQLHRHGYSCVLGTTYPEDLIPSSWYLSRHILFTTRPGSIIILHDGPSRGSQTIDILRYVLPELQRRGYRIVTISELTASDP